MAIRSRRRGLRAPSRIPSRVISIKPSCHRTSPFSTSTSWNGIGRNEVVEQSGHRVLRDGGTGVTRAPREIALCRIAAGSTVVSSVRRATSSRPFAVISTIPSVRVIDPRSRSASRTLSDKASRDSDLRCCPLRQSSHAASSTLNP